MQTIESWQIGGGGAGETRIVLPAWLTTIRAMDIAVDPAISKQRLTGHYAAGGA